MLEDVRQKNKRIYKIWDIVVVVILAILSDCNEWSEIEDFAYERKDGVSHKKDSFLIYL